MADANAAQEFIKWLQIQHDQIMDCEKQAIALMKADDIPGYRAKMKEKAIKLAQLATDAKPLLDKAPEYIKAVIGNQLGAFSSSAATSLSLDSVFYMSALLYPDEHKPGQPDNLEALIKKLEL